MNVTLVFPSIRNYGGFHSLGRHPDCIFINHGLSSISAVLKQKGHKISLIDLRECFSWDDFVIRLKESNPDIVCINMQTLDYFEAVESAKISKSLGLKTIAGGPHSSLAPNTLEKEPFDYIFVGEAEETFPEFLEEEENFDRIIVGKHPDLSKLPYEDKDIWNLNVILRTWNKWWSQPFINVISGRGCPYNCSFCKPGEDVIFGKFRCRSLDHFFGEIECLFERFNFRVLMIDDDTFTFNPDYVLGFCDRYEKIKRSFVCQSRTDFIVKNEDVIKRMKEVGLDMLLIGFESGSQRILNLLRKGTTVEMNLEASRICKKYGVRMWANYMLGNPTETKEESLATVEMVKRIKPEVLSPSFFTPIIGTDLYEYCKKENLLIDENPVLIGRRNPGEPKIKGIDYEYLNSIVKW